MAKKFLVPVDMSKLEIRNLLLHIIAGDASSPSEGQIWYDSSSKRIKFKTDAANLGLLTGGGDLSAGSVANSALTTNPLARGNHTGTQLASTISDFDTQVRTSRLDQMTAPTGSVSLNGQRGTNVATPVADTDAANKAYVDDSVAGLSWKNEVKVATTANITLSGTQTIDDIAVIASDRVLVKNQSTASENGIYTVAAGSWSRANDADTASEIAGAAVFVLSGTANGGTRWVSSTSGTITLNSTSITFAQFSGGSDYTAGDGLTLSGVDFSVGAGTGITVAANSVAIDTAVVVTKYAATIGDNSSTSIAVTHSLGTRDVIVQIYDAATYDTVECDVVRTSTSVVTLSFAVAPGNNALRVVVHS